MSDDTIECASTERLTAEPVLLTRKDRQAVPRNKPRRRLQRRVQFVSVALFGDTVPEMASRLHNGDRCYCADRLQLRAWTVKDGRERAGLSVSSLRAVALVQIGRRRPANSKALPVTTASTDHA